MMENGHNVSGNGFSSKKSRFDAVAGLSGGDEAGGGLPDSGDNIDQAQQRTGGNINPCFKTAFYIR